MRQVKYRHSNQKHVNQKHGSNKLKQKPKISYLALIIIGILIIVLVGDIIGAVMYLRQSPEMKVSLIQYIATGDSLSFLQIFWRQFLYQLTIWTMGLTIIGNIVNLFLIFARGVSAGFNLAFLVQEVGSFGSIWAILSWLVQYVLILFTTILSVYFSFRFAYLVIKSLIKKKYSLIKTHLKLYAMQFLFILILIMITSMFTAVTTPFIQNQISDDVTIVQ